MFLTGKPDILKAMGNITTQTAAESLAMVVLPKTAWEGVVAEIQELKNRFEKYGFIILSDSYKNAKEKLDVFDSQLNKRVRLSVQNMNYKIKTNQRSEFDFNNILNIKFY